MSPDALPGDDARGAGSAAAGTARLTDGEWHLLGLLAQSLTPAEVAAELGVPPERVRQARAVALRKLLGLRRPEALALYRALELGAR